MRSRVLAHLAGAFDVRHAAAAGDLRGEVSGVKVASPEAVVVVIDNVLP